MFGKPPKFKPVRSRRCSTVEGIAWVCFTLLSLVFGIYMTARAAADTYSDVEAGQLFLQDASGNKQASIHLHSQAILDVNGMIARVSLTQNFRNDTSDWQEGVYVFPLPENAAVNHMQMQIGDRLIVGEIKEKNIARKIYNEAKKSGKKAALVEQQRANLFTQKVANIPPGESIAVTLHYLQTVDYDNGEFSLRFPMTLTPRYIPGPFRTASQEPGENDQAAFMNASAKSSMAFNPLGWAMPTQQVPDAHEISPFMTVNAQGGNTIELQVSLNAGLPLAHIDARYHEINIRKNNDGHNVELRKGAVPMDRDFVLQWSPVGGSAPQAALFKETIDQEDYLLLMMVPPHGQQENGDSLSRDMIFIIDTSGSMQGSSIVQAKQSLQLALSRLKPGDQFNIIEFNSRFTKLFQQPQPADAYYVDKAIEWVSKLNAGGGTEMMGALQAALTQFEQSGNLQQVVFITDGAVGNESGLFQLIHQYLGDTRLFTVGIGFAPNSYFMRKSAQFGRGTFTHIGSTNEVSERMLALFEKLESAVVSHINVQWPSNVEVYPEKIPDLYRGEPLLLAAKTAAANGTVNIDGFTANASWSKALPINPQANHTGVATVWARAKVEDLEDKKHRGMSADEVRDKVIEVALLHKLVTAYTSFVAVEQEISRPQNESLKQSPVPNLVAKGQVVQPQTVSAQQVAYPQGATSSEISLLLGLFSLVVWLIYVLVRRLNGEYSAGDQ